MKKLSGCSAIKKNEEAALYVQNCVSTKRKCMGAMNPLIEVLIQVRGKNQIFDSRERDTCLNSFLRLSLLSNFVGEFLGFRIGENVDVEFVPLVGIDPFISVM